MNVHLIQEALGLYSQGQYEAAAAAFRQIGGADGAYGEADCLYQLGHRDEATQALHRCLALDPDHEDALVLEEALARESGMADDETDRTNNERPCLSRTRNRPFVGMCTYPTIEDLDRVYQAAKEALPEVESHYRPSGNTSFSASLLLLVATPVVLVLVAVLCGGLCLGWFFLESRFFDGGSFLAEPNPREVTAWLGIALDVVLVVLLSIVPSLIYIKLSRFLKNRIAWVPALLSGVVALLIAVMLFFPMIEGQSIAPTAITFASYSIRWLLIGAGLLIAPIVAAAYTHGELDEERSCDVTGVFLKPARRLNIDFDFGENARELLLQGRYDDVAQLPRCIAGHCARITLWWNKRAESAFLEMRVFFGSSVAKSKNGTKTKRDNWLAFSTRLDRTTAQRLNTAYAA